MLDRVLGKVANSLKQGLPITFYQYGGLRTDQCDPFTLRQRERRDEGNDGGANILKVSGSSQIDGKMLDFRDRKKLLDDAAHDFNINAQHAGDLAIGKRVDPRAQDG